MENWISIFTSQGVPMIILGFLLWYLVKPIFEAIIKNIETQTKINQEVLNSCNEAKAEMKVIREDLSAIKAALKN